MKKRFKSLKISCDGGAATGKSTGAKMIANKYKLKTVSDVIDNPQLFGGKFVGCPKGWGCYYANKNMFNAFNMKQKGWKLIKPSSAADLDRMIANAANSNQNWFGYYWAPTATVGKYNLARLDWGVSWAGENNWNNCIMQKKWGKS